MNTNLNAKTLPTRLNGTLALWLAVTVIFATVTALTARITISLPFTPVPITLQTLVVVLSGLVLGARGGALAQILYLSLIAFGLPLDARGLGPTVFVSPTAGYLIGFVPAAFVTGWLVEQLSVSRWWANFAAALTGVLLIYLLGANWLAVTLGSWQKAWLAGIAPFILFDLGKAAVAAAVAESGKYMFGRLADWKAE